MNGFWGDLLANSIGGLFAAGLIALFVYCKDRKKHRILKELAGIMGRIIEHRNMGEQKTYADKKIWILSAKALEEEAYKKANELSTTAGSFIYWLDRIPSSAERGEVAHYVSILSVIIVRIRGLLERHSF